MRFMNVVLLDGPRRVQGRRGDPQLVTLLPARAVFEQGGARTIRWSKSGPQSPVQVFDERARLAVEPGHTYIGIWGGFRETLRLLAQDGSEQPLPRPLSRWRICSPPRPRAERRAANRALEDPPQE